ncbi:unnamed protein product, partial [Closterium sp. NIES-53]
MVLSLKWRFQHRVQGETCNFAIPYQFRLSWVSGDVLQRALVIVGSVGINGRDGRHLEGSISGRHG